MTYKFALEDRDYSDYASGRVIYNLPGAAAFPVRLASEIFQRAWNLLQDSRNGNSGYKKGAPLAIFDPCCGAAYHLSALGFLHAGQIRSILAADYDPQAVAAAERNLGLLGPDGLNRREAELRGLLEQYGKPSHAEALKSVRVLRGKLESGTIPARVFRADVFDQADLSRELAGATIDLVLSDVPYGGLSGWQGQAPEETPVTGLLESLRAVLKAGTLVAVAADKANKIHHPAYRRLEHFRVGHRQISLLIFDK
jgi:23S rRNA (guanine2535-N1)-methyltransferase